MYLRITQRQNRDGSTVAYYALAESVWNPDAMRWTPSVGQESGRLKRESHRLPNSPPDPEVPITGVLLTFYIESILSF
jgi:hypothetical protein